MSEIRIDKEWLMVAVGIFLAAATAIPVLVYFYECVLYRKRLEKLGEENKREGWNLTVLKRRVLETEHKKAEKILRKVWREEESFLNPDRNRSE